MFTYFSPRTLLTDTNGFSSVHSLSTKPSQFNAPTIHSSKIRQNIYFDQTCFGKLRNGVVRRESADNSGPQLQLQIQKISRPATAQNWRKKLAVNVSKEEVEHGLRNYLGISQPFRPKTTTSKENAPYIPSRTGTSSTNKRIYLMNSSSVKTLKKAPSSVDILRRDAMCNTQELDVKNFTDDYMGEKYEHISIVKAPPKEYTRLLKLSNFDLTLVPSDSRRIIIEAIMRDFFLNLIPENTDFLICKNSQNYIYNILFTGRLVPTCKGCCTVTRFELSLDLGFQIICSSPYCNIKVLYRTKLSEKTIECLWPSSGTRHDIEPSLPIKGATVTKPMLSKLIQSGKFKNMDFSRVISDNATSQIVPEINSRPNTTANIMRTGAPWFKFTRVVVGVHSNSTSEGVQPIEHRPNTVQGLRRPGDLRPGTAGNLRPETAGYLRPETAGSNKGEEFRGMMVLKEFEDKGLFSKEKEDSRVIEQVSEEVSGDEEEAKVASVKKVTTDEGKDGKGSKRMPYVKKEFGRKGKMEKNDKFETYAKQVEKRNFFTGPGGTENSSKLDNSLEDIHNMVSILSKAK